MASAQKIPTLIAARPGLLRNSLLTFLHGLPLVEILGPVDSPADALLALRTGLPQVLIVDADLLAGGLVELLRQVRLDCPGITSIALVNTVAQQRQLLKVGAGHALLKGFLDNRLEQAVLGYMPPARTQDEQ